jgi:hypothetical protein
MGVEILQIFPFRKTKKQKIAEQVEILYKVFGGTIIEGGKK